MVIVVTMIFIYIETTAFIEEKNERMLGQTKNKLTENLLKKGFPTR